MNSIYYNKYIKYKKKIFKLKGGSVVPIIIFPEIHNEKQISTDIIKIFLENNIFENYDPKNILFVNEGNLKDPLFDVISKLPHNFTNSHFINEGIASNCEMYINLFCNFIEIFDQLIFIQLPGVNSLNLDQIALKIIFSETISRSKLNLYLSKIVLIINNKKKNAKINDMMTTFMDKYANKYLHNLIKYELYIEKFNELLKLIFNSFISSIDEHNFCSNNAIFKDEIIKYSQMINYDDRKTQGRLITKITRSIRDGNLINKIENYICENQNIKIIILLCGFNHFINLYNLINNNNSLFKNHSVNNVIYDHIILKKINLDSLSVLESIKELSTIYDIMKTTLKINISKINTYILNHCFVCNKNKYNQDIKILKCSCHTRAYCGKEHQTFDWKNHKKEHSQIMEK